MKTGLSVAAAAKTAGPFPADRDDAAGEPLLSLVPDTLETLLTNAIVALRSSPESSASPPDVTLACRRDAIAVIEIGRTLGLLQSSAPHLRVCRAP